MEEELIVHLDPYLTSLLTDNELSFTSNAIGYIYHGLSNPVKHTMGPFVV